MGFDVKKTTKWGLMDWLCPHYCRGCGQLGEPICDCCKNDIFASNMVFWQDYEHILMVGKRDGLLGAAVKEYKYGPVRALSDALASLLAKRLAIELAGVRKQKVVLVPLPTIVKHVRSRGFDHMWLIGKKLAKLGGWRCEKILERKNNTVQVGKNREERIAQAKMAYAVRKKLVRDKIYVLLDDVWTTGASMMAAESEMQKMGAVDIKKLVIAVSEDD